MRQVSQCNGVIASPPPTSSAQYSFSTSRGNSIFYIYYSCCRSSTAALCHTMATTNTVWQIYIRPLKCKFVTTLSGQHRARGRCLHEGNASSSSMRLSCAGNQTPPQPVKASSLLLNTALLSQVWPAVSARPCTTLQVHPSHCRP